MRQGQLSARNDCALVIADLGARPIPAGPGIGLANVRVMFYIHMVQGTPLLHIIGA